MKTFTRNTLFAYGYSIVNHTDDQKLSRFMRSLRPQDCGQNLIRIGGNADGGYLIPNDLDGIEYCFSPGVSSVADFENQLADIGIKSFLADYSVQAPPNTRPEFTFDKKFLGCTDDEQHFTLASWKNKYLSDYGGDLILQMDIEGSEYEVIFNIPDDLLQQFRILVIEFHDLHKLFDPFCFSLFETCFGKISKYFQVAHVHANNCCGSLRKGGLEIPRIMEFTFYNKKRVSDCKNVDVFPHPLDRDNVPENKPLELPRCWYSDRS